MGLVVVHLTPSPPRRGPKLTCPRTTPRVAPDGDPSILFGADDSDIGLPPSPEQGSIGLVVVNLTPSPPRRGPKLTCPRRRGPKLTCPRRRGPKLTCPRTTPRDAPDGAPSIFFGADDSDIGLPPSREQGSMGLVVVHLTPSPPRRGPKLTCPPRRGPKLTCPRTTPRVAPDGDPSILFSAGDSDIGLPPSPEQGSMGLVVVHLTPSPPRRGPKLTCPRTTTRVAPGGGPSILFSAGDSDIRLPSSPERGNSPYLLAGSIG
jgi:hypothetical protein